MQTTAVSMTSMTFPADRSGALRTLLFLWLISLVIPAHVLAQAVPRDVVELRDGGIVRGTIVEYLPRDHVTIQLVTGELRTFAAAEVEYAGEVDADPALLTDDHEPDEEDGATHGDVHLRVLSPDVAGFVLHLRGGGAASTCELPCSTFLTPGDYALGASRGEGGVRALLSSFALDSNSAFVFHYESQSGKRAAGAAVLSTMLPAGGSLIVVGLLWLGSVALVVVGGAVAFLGSIIGSGLLGLRDHMELEPVARF